MKDISTIIRNRRAIKPKAMKEGSVVPKEVIVEVLENAIWAPNHGKTEPWHFLVYTGNALKHFCGLHADVYRQGAGDKFNDAKYNALANWYKTVGCMIVVLHRRSSQSRIRENEEREAVACAVQNMWLTVEAYNYAGMWATGGGTYMPEIIEILPMEHNDHLMGFFLIGERSVDGMPGIRKPLNDKVSWMEE